MIRIFAAAMVGSFLIVLYFLYKYRKDCCDCCPCSDSGVGHPMQAVGQQVFVHPGTVKVKIVQMTLMVTMQQLFLAARVFYTEWDKDPGFRPCSIRVMLLLNTACLWLTVVLTAITTMIFTLTVLL
nr:hypothetical protein BaRGS_016646 [Batillaria attramentaria]